MPTPITGSPVSFVGVAGDPGLDGLLIGTKWGGATGTGALVEFSFPDASSVWSTVQGGDVNGYDATDPDNNNPFASQYHGLDSTQQDAARAALAAWSHVAGIGFSEVAESATLVGDIRVAFTNGGGMDAGTYAYAYTPAPFAFGGDVWLNSTQPVPSGNDFSTGANGYATLIHELGHAIGLDHPFEHPAFPPEFDSFKYTVMSYSDFPGHQDTGDSSLYPSTPMLLDIQALQYLYGANMDWASGDDTYVFTEGGHYYETIWDAGGTDTLVYDSAADGALIDLRAGHFSQLGAPIALSDGSLQDDDVAIAFGAVIEIAIGGDGNDVIIGNGADNTLVGGFGDDSLSGGAGADLLDGGGGSDALGGGSGNDTYRVDALDSVSESPGAGIDTVESALSYALPAEVENLTLTGIDDVNATGNALNNVLTGNSGANVLNGGGGVDLLIGGAGNDTYVVDSSGDQALETAPGDGVDSVVSSASFTLGAHVENLTLTGAGASNATGNALANVLTGNSGANVLDGAGGADVLAGGLGNDTYVIDATDIVLEQPGEGADTIQAGFSFILADDFENLLLVGTADLDATGNAADNRIFGNAGDNVIDGLAGNDTMSGDIGDDTYYVAQSGDSVIEASASGGLDRVFSLVSFTLGAHLEELTLMGSAALDAIGNALDNVLTGNAADNLLDGRGGADLLIGGGGNDRYVIDAGDEIVEAVGDGVDSALASASCVLADEVENLALAGIANLDATGNTLDNLISGNAGANVLDGAEGADTLAGGAGNDTYVVDAFDTVVELAAEGTDTVRAGFSYALGANLENLVLTGTGDFEATGNDAANVLTGNAGNNVLNGGAGDDLLEGGAGNDVFYIVDDGDRFADSGGIDTVVSARSASLGGLAGGIENLTLLEHSAARDATGNAQDNVLQGNRADNVLSGQAGDDVLVGLRGNDTLVGGAGNDSYYIERAGDLEREAAGAGIDTAYSSVNHVLGANVENLVLTGNALKGFGNALGNAITGDARNNRLEGGAGNDTLNGGAGVDTLLGGAGADAFLFATAPGGSNVDRIADFLSGTDKLELDNAIFTALGASGALAPAAFASGDFSAAQDADDRLIYDTSTGALYYDPDGTGGDPQTQIAALSGVPVLLASDIQVV